jgi:competence protein ComEA
VGGALRRPPPSHRWLVALRTRVVDELRIIGLRRVVSVATALVVIAVVLWWLLRPAAEPVEARLPFAAPVTAVAVTASTSPGGAPPTDTMVVHVVGEVVRPGLVELIAGARVADAIDGAGGATDAAQVHAVNLAAPVRDGQRIHVPHRDEAVVSAQPVGDTSAGDTAVTGGPVNLNQADVDQLTRLPGVGPAIAAAIVAHRERRGPFASVDALLDVPGIGPAKLEGLRDLATV